MKTGTLSTVLIIIIVFVSGISVIQLQDKIRKMESETLRLESMITTNQEEIAYLKGYNKFHDDWIIDLYLCFGFNTIETERTINLDEVGKCIYLEWLEVAEEINEIRGQLLDPSS